MVWIAKPLASLNASEREDFNLVLEQAEDRPVAQTLEWARGLEALGAKLFAVYEDSFVVGGIVYEGMPGQFECVNGPTLHWDDPNEIAGQFATFVFAIHKMAPAFESIAIRPRWKSELVETRLARIPIAPTRIEEASTWIIPLMPTETEQKQIASERLKRTLKRAEPLAIVTIDQWNEDALERFVSLVQKKGEEKKFATPPIEWFKSLVQNSENFFSVVSESKYSRTELLINVHGKKAHYLFGATEKYSENSKDSTSTVAHFKVIEKLRTLGVTHYDLNGYVVNADPTHPYFGVAEYKKQFGGYPVEYSQVVFEIK